MKNHLCSILFAACLAFSANSSAQPTDYVMKQVHYHQAGKEPKLFDVLQEYADGTVDLGHFKAGEASAPVVAGCKLLEQAEHGCATLFVPSKVVTAPKEPARDDLEKALKGATAEIEKLRDQLAKADAENAGLKNDLVRLQKDYVALGEDGGKFLTELEATKAELATAKAELAKKGGGKDKAGATA